MKKNFFHYQESWISKNVTVDTHVLSFINQGKVVCLQHAVIRDETNYQEPYLRINLLEGAGSYLLAGNLNSDGKAMPMFFNPIFFDGSDRLEINTYGSVVGIKITICLWGYVTDSVN